ncbi:hypothetical protein [Dethiobacter alkaliphilus]|uniref:Uncharacterized protein n=1 Tax=Dethiobacter alkaliphilus AHT 1 TaxID=555088 RepID=C0GEH8_DETAL|nr:hypothetical protein [Dethiobacter alkaliphilus]EEG78472.1 conserved hypothetical protein [Dethiobacter alkaliphilus AHT 1]
MGNDNQVFELMTKMYAEMQKGFKDVNDRIQATNVEVQSIKGEIQNVKNTVIKIEADHGLKFGALFDGHTQVSQKLDRIEAEVSKHDEFILKKIK